MHRGSIADYSPEHRRPIPDPLLPCVYNEVDLRRSRIHLPSVYCRSYSSLFWTTHSHLLHLSELNSMSAGHANTSIPHRHPRLASRPISGLAYIRKYAYAPEVLPLVGVVTFAVTMGLYFSADAALKNDVTWQPRTQPWLKTPTNSVRWDGAGGVREAVVKEYQAAKEKAKSLIE
ncbi:unnamed protein product [Rhizoctonia solani]|uniref:Uncharacterized protein n=1 Tax=Rhizoctonia solani TaxID=456999 RepID=A0A8H3H7B7_9AGAM|nr:unnamed protein product [Rhizoctonia solani]